MSSISRPSGGCRGARARTGTHRATDLTLALLVAAIGVAHPAQARPPAAQQGDPSTGSAGQAAYRLTLKIVDGSTGQPTAARLRVLGGDGKDAYPWPRESALYHEAYSGHHYFYADGSVTLLVPGGHVTVLVSKGFEYQAASVGFNVTPEAVAGTQTITLQRFADLAPYGWRSGDTHVHTHHTGDDTYPVSHAAAFLMQRAEDVNVVNLLEDETEFTGTLDPLSTATNLLYVGGEYRSGFWGHLDVLGVTTMPYLFCCSAGQPAWPMNVDLVRDARNRGGMVFFAHPLTVPRSQLSTVTGAWPSVGHGRELPIDVALGCVDALDIYSYSNLNRIEFQLWYDLLNHGFRIPANAGTDASVNRFTDPMLGGYRTYAQVGSGPFTHAQWLQAVRQGNSFVTNGPLIRSFTVGGAPPGTVLNKTVNESYSQPVMYDVVSQWPIQYVALVVDGSYQRIIRPTTDPYHMSGTTVANTYGGSGWAALFVYAPWPGYNTFTTFGSLLYAHSSPVYIDVAGHPLRFGGDDPLYYVNWVDDVWALADSRGWATPANRDSALARVTLARSILLSRTTAAPPAPTSPGVDVPAAASTPPPAASVVAERAGSNIRFRFAHAPGAPESFELFDVQGRAVFTQRLLQLDLSAAGWEWRPGGLDTPLPRGLYFARFRGAGWSASVRVVL